MKIDPIKIKNNLHNLRLLASEYKDKISYDESKETAFLGNMKQKGIKLNSYQEDFLKSVQEIQSPILSQIVYFAKGILHELARPGSSEEDETELDIEKV